MHTTPAGTATARIDASAQGRTASVFVGVLGFAIGAVIVALISSSSHAIVRLNDFYTEARLPYLALANGRLHQFIVLAPAYYGSLVIRAPFALVAAALGGHWRAMYLATSLPCVAAAAVYCAWLSAQPRRRGGVGWASRLNPMLLFFLNPIMLAALLDGHPEEILGAVMCATGVVLATKGEEDWAAILIGLAVVNKAWALVALPVMLAAMPAGRRLRASVISLGVAGIVLIPLAIVRAHGLSVAATSGQLGSSAGTTEFPIQLLWWFGANSWPVVQSRKLIIIAAFVCSGLWWVARRRTGGADGARRPAATSEALLLLALVLLLRAALDPVNNLYYHVPFLLALISYEVCSGRTPRLSALYSLALLAVAAPLVLGQMGNDARAAAYAAVALPAILWMAAILFVPPDSWRRLSGSIRRAVSPARPGDDGTPA